MLGARVEVGRLVLRDWAVACSGRGESNRVPALRRWMADHLVKRKDPGAIGMPGSEMLAACGHVEVADSVQPLVNVPSFPV